MLKIKNQTNETAELYISGDIVDDVEGGLIRYFQEGDTTGIEFPQKFREELWECVCRGGVVKYAVKAERQDNLSSRRNLCKHSHANILCSR